jgi:hypothetical protein
VPVAYHLLHFSCKTSKNKGLGMNAKIEKTINGRAISANPVFKGGMRPAYWSCAINNRIIDKVFGSASEVFRFAEKIKQH